MGVPWFRFTVRPDVVALKAFISETVILHISLGDFEAAWHRQPFLLQRLVPFDGLLKHHSGLPDFS